MSRSKAYQHLLNDKRWKQLRMQYLQTHPLCERCKANSHYRSAIDVHHRTPVESAKSAEEMRRLAYDWKNLQALCPQCHAEVHAEMRSHSKEAHQQREADRLQQWIAKQRKPPRDMGGKPAGPVF